MKVQLDQVGLDCIHRVGVARQELLDDYLDGPRDPFVLALIQTKFKVSNIVSARARLAVRSLINPHCVYSHRGRREWLAVVASGVMRVVLEEEASHEIKMWSKNHY